MRKLIITAVVALAIACGGKVADSSGVASAACAAGDPRAMTCGASGDECATTLVACDGTPTASTCYCTGQHLWSCDVAVCPPSEGACMQGGTCSGGTCISAGSPCSCVLGQWQCTDGWDAGWTGSD